MSKVRLVASASLLVLFLMACAPAATPASAPTPAVQAAPAAGVVEPKSAPKEAWQVKWDNMLESAKKEGKIVIFSTSSAETRIAFNQAFKAKFGIDTEFVGGSAAAMGAKVMAERRAGLRLGDLIMGAGTQVVSLIKPAGYAEPIEVGGALILPEFSDPKLWRGGKFFYQDPEHTSLTYASYESHVVARNTELTKEGELQSYNDLLNPKWKGKIVMADPVLGGVAVKALVMVGRYTMGWDWLRALVKQEPTIVNDFRIQTEWVARGKYAIAYARKTDIVYEFREMGLPVENVIMREGGYLSSGSGMVTLLKDAPHPNAAKLFINWLLTKEGQTIFSRTGGYPSVRLDVPDEGLMNRRAAPDSKAPSGDTEEAILKQNEDLKLAKEILLPLFQK